MSLRDVSMFYVLGEDAAHRSFIRAWLNANGVKVRRVQTIEPPANKSGGIQFVLSRCKETVEDARHRDKVVAKTRVIIAIDADEETVEARLSKIKLAIDGGGNDSLDVVCVLIPKRHIETWVHTLGPTQPEVNEQDDYKEKTTQDLKSAARRLADLNSPPASPPSLVHGYRQLQRLKDI